jgi:TfoX/Sxy family transcriptional regulator of competence genes
MRAAPQNESLMAKRPTMPKADPKTSALFHTLLPADDRVTVRPMFGHSAAFVNGNMFAGTFGSHVFVRLDEAGRGELLAMPGAAAFAPMNDRPMKEYVQLPGLWLGEPATAKIWVVRALEWTARLAVKSAGRKPDRRASVTAKKAQMRKKRQ